MSINEVELVRRWFAAYAHGDRARALGYVSDRCRVVEADGVATPGRYTGGQGLERWLLDERRVAPDLAPDHFLEVGDRVVVLCREWTPGQGCERHAEHRFALAWSVEHARITGLEFFSRWEDALCSPDTGRPERRRTVP